VSRGPAGCHSSEEMDEGGTSEVEESFYLRRVLI
jgi:hypothetical protein